MPNRLSVSIFLSFVAILIAFYSGFVFSQALPSGGARPLRAAQATLAVSVNVLSTCNFQIYPQAQGVPERPATQNSGFGARCSLTQPLVVSGSTTSGGVTTASTSQAHLQVSPGSTRLSTQTGTPYWAETTDAGLLVTF
jgi:hypothetical protein